MAQIALSLMLLFAAGLFFRGALKAAGLNPGFVAAGDIITEFDFTLIKKEPAESRRTIFAMIQRARELPGVTASAVGTMLPYADFTTARRILRAKDMMPSDPKAPDPSVNRHSGGGSWTRRHAIAWAAAAARSGAGPPVYPAPRRSWTRTRPWIWL